MTPKTTDKTLHRVKEQKTTFLSASGSLPQFSGGQYVFGKSDKQSTNEQKIVSNFFNLCLEQKHAHNDRTKSLQRGMKRKKIEIFYNCISH